MLSFLDNSEVLKVSTKEFKEQILSPNEPSVDKERSARQARSEKHKVFSRQGANEIPVASMARWEERRRGGYSKEEDSRSGKGEVEREEEKTVVVKRALLLLSSTLYLSRTSSSIFTASLFQHSSISS